MALADDVHVSLGYDRVLLVPANLPPHKALAGGASPQDRLAMLRLAAQGSDSIGVDDCELARGGLSFTIDTVAYLEQKYAGSLEGKIGLVIGQDLVPGFVAWNRHAELAEKTEIIIAKRPGCRVGDFPYPFTELSNPLLSVSSSEIRANIAAGKSWRYLVPEGVYRYIVEHTLYEY